MLSDLHDQLRCFGIRLATDVVDLPPDCKDISLEGTDERRVLLAVGDCHGNVETAKQEHRRPPFINKFDANSIQLNFYANKYTNKLAMVCFMSIAPLSEVYRFHCGGRDASARGIPNVILPIRQRPWDGLWDKAKRKGRTRASRSAWGQPPPCPPPPPPKY